TATVGRNPANGAVVYYTLKSKPTSDVVLEFLDASGKSIQKFTGKPARDAAAAQPSPAASPSASVQPAGQASPTPAAATSEEVPAGGEEPGGFGAPRPPRVTTDVGVNRFVWDLRYPESVRFPGLILWAGE